MSYLTVKEIKRRLTSIKELKNKIAYYSFRKAQTTPYCIFYRSSTSDIGADNKPSNLKEQVIVIELYTSLIDEDLEQKIENLFKEFELEKSESWIEESEEYMIRYAFTQFIK